MAEIKSTMDLVMEKVGKMKITAEEREKFKREEVQDQAQRLFHRYFVQEEQKDLRSLKMQLQDVKEEIKEVLKELLISAYSLKDPSVRIIEGLKILAGEREGRVIEALEELASSYQREKEEKLQQLEKEYREELARRGISGTAVEVNLSAHPHWADFIGQLNKKYEGKKREILDKLR